MRLVGMVSLGCGTQQEGDSCNKSVTQGPSSLEVLMLKSLEVLVRDGH